MGFTETDKRVLLAFIINTAAGLSTCVGGILIFSKRLVYLAKPARLAIALGMSAGVMIFISLVEIFHKSIEKFEQGLSKTFANCTCEVKCLETITRKEQESLNKCTGTAWLFASLCFLLGAALIYILDFIVHKISPYAEAEPDVVMEELSVLQSTVENQNEPQQVNDQVETNSRKPTLIRHKLNAQMKQKLEQTGILMAIAIALHNLPEGMATYLGVLKDPRFGYALAIGIALHNIPEGVAVAIPVYFATENRFKAFLYTLISALAEPTGGFICWLLTRNKNEDELEKQHQPYLEGIIFGLIPGIMVTISLKELLPTAYRYSSRSSRITLSVLIGMMIMTISLILFSYAGV